MSRLSSGATQTDRNSVVTLLRWRHRASIDSKPIGSELGNLEQSSGSLVNLERIRGNAPR